MNGLERIKILASEIKDQALLEIINYLLSREDMNEKYLNEEKSLAQMVSFIRQEAQKESKDGMAMIKDEVVFGWAIHYFDESNVDLKLTVTKEKNQVNTAKEVEIDEPVQTPIISITKPKKKKVVSEGQLTLFDL